ncbi:MAG: flagellar motor switch protein FliN [Anaerolineaceae bacterium]|nr:flagellar motor switch protein FliN [Anaerolineaceae bacterium]
MADQKLAVKKTRGEAATESGTAKTATSDDALAAVEKAESQLGDLLSNLDGPAEGNSAGPASAASGAATSIDLLRDVTLNVKIELGRSRMYIEDILKLGEGSIVELEKLAGDPVDVFVNDRLVARGEVLVLNDNFCVRIGEIVTQE